MIIPTPSPFDSPILPILKPGKNKGCLMVNYYNLHTLVPSIGPPDPTSNIIKITNSTQSTTSKYFALIDLVKTFCSVPVSTASQLQIAFTSKGTQDTFSRLLMGHINSWLSHTIFAEKIDQCPISCHPPYHRPGHLVPRPSEGLNSALPASTTP